MEKHSSLPLLIIFLVLLPVSLILKYLFNLDIEVDSVITSVAALTYAYMGISYGVTYNKNLGEEIGKGDTNLDKFKPLAYCWIAYLILAYVFILITSIDIPMTTLFVTTAGVVGVFITGNKLNNFSIHGSNFNKLSNKEDVGGCVEGK